MILVILVVMLMFWGVLFSMVKICFWIDCELEVVEGFVLLFWLMFRGLLVKVLKFLLMFERFFSVFRIICIVGFFFDLLK